MRGDPEKQIDRYLRKGAYDDHLYSAWPGAGLLDRAKRGHAALRLALLAEVKRRTMNTVEPEVLHGLDVIAFTRVKVAPMVRGLFPRREQEAVLKVLERSVIFLTPSNIDAILGETHWHNTAWDLANLYLASLGAELLSDDAPRIVGLSEETTCYVSVDYFQPCSRFEDFVVHEAAHIFHNCKRRTIGLPEIRRREWLLQIEFAKRETFAYACEAYSRILEHGGGPANRRLLLEELEQESMPADDYMDTDEYIDILREAAAVRNGWRRILERCSAPR